MEIIIYYLFHYKMSSYEGEYITQYKTDKPYNWSNADAYVKRRLTVSEVSSFKALCARFNAELVELTIMPDYGWWFKIQANGEITPLSQEIMKFAKNL